MGDFTGWLAYKKGFELAMEIFEVSKSFPLEEKYSLTDQIRRASRSVCTNLAEAYRRKKYIDYFLSKLNDSETENTETEVWLRFAFVCKYLAEEHYSRLSNKNTEVGKLLYYMSNNPEKFS